jgi:hypothetical protein
VAEALNYCPKAIADLLSYPCPGAPGTAAGNRYIAGKLREAQVFQLPDCGQLLDRTKPRPEVPGAILKPAFPVVALEYTATDSAWNEGPYNEVPCPKRIALAWEWSNDLPSALRSWQPQGLERGVMISSVFLHGIAKQWLASPVVMHIAYDDEWQQHTAGTPFREAMIASGRVTPKVAAGKSVKGTPVAVSPETIVRAVQQAGSMERALDFVSADVMDELNAYIDLCMALACKNVSTVRHPAPERLNRQRIKAGKAPLKDFHVLQIAGGGTLPGSTSDGAREGPRSHLRRGHIRRLGGDRVTWVNSTIVGGKGFVDKVYQL